MNIEMDDEVDMNVFDDESEDEGDEDDYVSSSSSQTAGSGQTDIVTAAVASAASASKAATTAAAVVVPSQSKLRSDKAASKSEQKTELLKQSSEESTSLQKKKATANEKTPAAKKKFDSSDKAGTLLDKEQKEQEQHGMFPDTPAVPGVIDMEEPKAKHRTLTFQEDPMQFHAKPRDLARNALKRPREMDHTAVVTSHIFSRCGFRPYTQLSALFLTAFMH